jgi:hypothetical protein
MKNKSYFLRTDLGTYSKKFLMLCNEYVYEAPQKTIKTEENRVKTIIITEKLKE